MKPVQSHVVILLVQQSDARGSWRRVTGRSAADMRRDVIRVTFPEIRILAHPGLAAALLVLAGGFAYRSYVATGPEVPLAVT